MGGPSEMEARAEEADAVRQSVAPTSLWLDYRGTIAGTVSERPEGLMVAWDAALYCLLRTFL
jgi:hypothetical protein